jgi:hypothetical protein
MGDGPTSVPMVWWSGLAVGGLGPPPGATPAAVALEDLASDGMSDPCKAEPAGGRPFHVCSDKDQNWQLDRHVDGLA